MTIFPPNNAEATVFTTPNDAPATLSCRFQILQVSNIYGNGGIQGAPTLGPARAGAMMTVVITHTLKYFRHVYGIDYIGLRLPVAD